MFYNIFESVKKFWIYLGSWATMVRRLCEEAGTLYIIHDEGYHMDFHFPTEKELILSF